MTQNSHTSLVYDTDVIHTKKSVTNAEITDLHGCDFSFVHYLVLILFNFVVFFWGGGG